MTVCIEQVEIKNLRSNKKISLKLKGFYALIGYNKAGKSNFSVS